MPTFFPERMPPRHKVIPRFPLLRSVSKEDWYTVADFHEEAKEASHDRLVVEYHDVDLAPKHIVTRSHPELSNLVSIWERSSKVTTFNAAEGWWKIGYQLIKLIDLTAPIK